MQLDFIDTIHYIDDDTKETALPTNVLRDINLLYTYNEQDFEIFGVPVIENMIENVAYTQIGSRWYEPEFGSKLLTIIYEPCTLPTANKMEIEIFSSIKRWVPYVDIVIRNTVVIPYPDDNLFRAYYNYIDIFTGLNRNFTLDFKRGYIS